MIRKAALLAVSLCMAVLAFAATSLAVGQDPEPHLRANLPAAALPAFALGESEALRINDILGETGSIAGITPDSYEQVRLLTKTAVGPLYLIPGTRGTCMFLKSGSVCGDPGGPDPGGADSRFNAILTLDSSGQTLVGGGVADASVDRIEVVVTGHGVRRLAPVIGGVFSITLTVPGFKPGKEIQFFAH